jgi:hypothetical protein
MRGTNRLDDLFSYPALARFDPAPQKSLPTAPGLPLVTDDFCGTPRSASVPTAGAVEPAQECARPRMLLETYLNYRDPDPGSGSASTMAVPLNSSARTIDVYGWRGDGVST